MSVLNVKPILRSIFPTKIPFGLSSMRLPSNKCIIWFLIYVFGYLKFDLLWVILGVASYYLVKTWRKSIQVDQTKKTPQPVESDSDVSASKSENSIPLPSWVLHPDMHRVEWANMVIQQLWPHVEQYLVHLLRSVEEDQQMQDRLTGYHIKYLKFPVVNLGKIPPRITGIKVHKSVHRDEIIMDIGVNYTGDLCIQMEVALDSLPSYIPPASASFRNLSLTSSNLRIHLRPLLTDVPFVGAVTISFLQSPEIDFDLGGIANAFDVPGVSMLLRHVIQDQLEQTIVMPNSMTIELASSTDLDRQHTHKRPSTFTSSTSGTSLSKAEKTNAAVAASLPAGVLNIHVVEAKGLVNKDTVMFGKSDPYTTLQVQADGETHQFKTEVIQNNLHPVWKMLVDLPVDNPETLDDLIFTVFDEDRYGKDEFLGKCSVSVQVIRTAITSGQTQDVWKVLEGVKRGSLHLQIGWSELKLSMPPEETGPSPSHRAALVVIVDSCTNLLGGRTGLKLPNPRVKVEVCGVVQFTDTVVGCVDPVFSHRMSFLVSNPQSDNLIISVEDDRREKHVLGTLRLDLSDLIERTSLSMINHRFPLTSRVLKGNRSPEIVLTVALRYIHRPKTFGYGVHKSLQELQQIMLTTVHPPNKATSQQPGNLPSKDEIDFKPQPNVMVNGEHKIANGRPADQQLRPQVIPKEPTKVNTTPKKDINAEPKMTSSEETNMASAPTHELPKVNGHQSSSKSSTVQNGFLEMSPKLGHQLHESKSDSKLEAKQQLEERSASEQQITESPPPKTLTLPLALNDFAKKSEEARQFVRANSVSAFRSRDHIIPMTSPVKEDLRPKIQLSLKYNIRTKTMSVVVHRIKNLAETHHTSIPSAYVKIRILERAARPGSNRRLPHTKRKTKTQRQTASPIFEETLEYCLHESDLRHRRLEVSVWHDSRLSVLGLNTVLGRCLVNLDPLAAAVAESQSKAGNSSIEVGTTLTDWHVLSHEGDDGSLEFRPGTPLRSTLPRKGSNRKGRFGSKGSLHEA